MIVEQTGAREVSGKGSCGVIMFELFMMSCFFSADCAFRILSSSAPWRASFSWSSKIVLLLRLSSPSSCKILLLAASGTSFDGVPFLWLLVFPDMMGVTIYRGRIVDAVGIGYPGPRTWKMSVLIRDACR